MSTYISALIEMCLVLVGLIVLLLANFVVPNRIEMPNRKRTIQSNILCIGLLLLSVFGIATIPSYQVPTGDLVIMQPEIPASGYVEVKSEYFSIYLPSSWQERKYSDVVLYYDDTERDSFTVTYEKARDFRNLGRFSLIRNAGIQRAEIITYMGHDMLILEEEHDFTHSYTYMFNCDNRAVIITLTFPDTAADVHEKMFRSIQIND